MPDNRKTAGKTRSGKHSSLLTTREQKRNAGYQLLQHGLSKAAVAMALDISWVTANRWSKQLKAKQPRKHDKQRIGRPKKLNNKQLATLKRLLKKGALTYGYPTELWTLKRVANVIEKEFGVKYNTTHVWRVLRSLRLLRPNPPFKSYGKKRKSHSGMDS